MYYKWLERAYLGGVRLITKQMVSNEALCGAGKRRSNFTCNDMDAVDKQIQATKDLERAIDRMDDGVVNNTGWYRIAYSPAHARQIIRAGKLAVVMGIEVDSLFDCKPGIPPARASTCAASCRPTTTRASATCSRFTSSTTRSAARRCSGTSSTPATSR